MIQDIRYALRSLSRNKPFAVTALLVLSLGIGATTAVFTAVNRTVLRPLPFASADRLVQLYGTPQERGTAIGWADVEEFRAMATSFDALTGYNVGGRYLQGPDGLERVMTVGVERGFFSLLGAGPLHGRTFVDGDSSNVAVAGEGFWRRRLGGDAGAVGSAVTVNGIPYTIVGIMPDSFQFPYGAASLIAGVASQVRTDLWILTPPPDPRARLSSVIGRLKPGATAAAAESELALIMKRLESQSPQRVRGLGVRIEPLSEAIVQAPIRRSLFILFGAAGIVLLLACANVTNLLLVRVMVRSKEVAARIALGAGSLRLIRGFLAESLIITIIAGGAGLLLAWWGTAQFMRIAAAHLPRSHENAMDLRVFALSLGLCLLSGFVFGVAQLLSVNRRDIQSALRGAGGHHTMSGRQRRLRDGLVVAEVALAFVLAVGATLLIRELVRLRNTDTGMVATNVVTLHVGQQMTQGMDGSRFYDIAGRIRQLPGVREAGFIQVLPLQNWGWASNTDNFPFRGQTNPNMPSMQLRYVTPGYFRALGIPIKRGRGITDADNRTAPRVILINETMARLAFGAGDPIGQTTTRGTVIGIVADVRQVNLDEPALPELYFPIAQNWSQLGELGMTLVVKTEGPPLALTDAIRSRIREFDSNLALFDIKTMDRVVADSMSELLLYLTLMFIFASVALFLALTGTYGVIAYIAVSRSREFAVRIALGASSPQVAWLVLGNAFRLTGIGLICGFAAVLAARPLFGNLPAGVRPPDAAIIVPVGVMICVLGVIACVVPARRAASADPMSTLRNE